MSAQSVIILDGEQKSALCAVRSCGRAGFAVVVGATRQSALARHSRYTDQSFSYPDPYADPAGFIAAFKKQLQAVAGRPIVYAFSDATHSLLEMHREELQPLLYFAWNTADARAIANNKAATYSEAKLLGVPVIPTYLLENEGEVSRRSAELQFPAVVKPRHSVSWQNDHGIFATASFVHSVAELCARFTLLKKQTGESPLIQPLVRGEEYGVEMLCRDGSVVAEVVHHRIRSLSPTGGASVVRETIGDSVQVDEMRQAAYKLATALSWHGPLMVEFKVDEDSRQPLLMEINGRFWGSLPLAVAAGVDFPQLYAQLLLGTLPAETVVSKGRNDVVCRWWLGDIRHLLRVWVGKSAMRSQLYPTRRKALRDFLRSYRTASFYDVWQWNDPLPAWWQYIDVIKR